MKQVLLAVAAAAAASAFLTSAAGAATARGVVVSRSHGTMLVATHSGRLVAIRGHAAIGSRVVGRRVVGHARYARIHGVVVQEKASSMIVVSNHHLIAIHRSSRGLAGTSSNSGPAPGTIVTTTVTVNNDGQLNEDDQGEDGQDSSSTVTVTAVVDAVGPGTVTLNVNGTDVTFDLPAGLTLPQSLVGQTVTIQISIGDDDNNQGDE
jgi:hypothetical protein